MEVFKINYVSISNVTDFAECMYNSAYNIFFINNNLRLLMVTNYKIIL